MGSGQRNEDDEEDILALLGGGFIEEGADGAAYVLLVVGGDCSDVKRLTLLTKVLKRRRSLFSPIGGGGANFVWTMHFEPNSVLF